MCKRQNTSFDDKDHTLESLKALCVKDKLQIATALLGDLNYERSEKQEKNEVVVNEIAVEIEAVEMRLVDLEKDALMFRRDFVSAIHNNCTSGSTGSRGEQIMTTLDDDDIATPIIKSERLLRYFQRQALQLDSTKDKVKLQQIDHKKKLQKIESKLKQSEEIENNFHYIDVHQLKASNKQCMKTLKVKTKQLDKLKMTFEKTEKELLQLKGRLKELEKGKQKAEKSLELRQRHLERLDEKIKRRDNENIRIQKDITSDSCNDELDEGGSTLATDSIDVMDIVNQQTKIYELKAAIKSWTKKVEIAHLVKKNQGSKQNFGGKQYN